MDAQRRTAVSASDFATYWRYHTIVHTDPRMRGEPKSAWDFLYVDKARFQLTTIDVSAEAVADAQGKELKSGVRSLEALARHGYIQVIDRPQRKHGLARGGPWKIFLNDPSEVAIARPGQESHGQGELFELQDAAEPIADDATISLADHRAKDLPGNALRPAEVQFCSRPPDVVTADVAPQPPISLHLKQSKSLRTYHLENLNLERGGSRRGDGGCGPTTAQAGHRNGPSSAARIRLEDAEQSPETPAIGGLLAGLTAQLDRPELGAQNVERTTAWILSIACEPRLQPALARRWARLIVAGQWSAADCAAMVADVRRKIRLSHAGKLEEQITDDFAYLYGAACKSIERNDRGAR
jgi:hypothetical protein